MKFTCLSIFAFSVCVVGFGAPKLNMLEFNGIMRFQGSDRVSIKDLSSGESSWLEVGQFFHEIKLEEIRKDRPEIVLRSGNATRTIELQSGKIVRLRKGPLVVKRDSNADIAFDAIQTVIFERGQELSKKRSRRD